MSWQQYQCDGAADGLAPANHASATGLDGAARADGAFAALHTAYWEPLCRYAARFVDGSAAEDIVADLFATLWERRDAWALRGDVQWYLCRAVRNRALRVLSRVSRAERWAAAVAIGDHASGMGQAISSPDYAVWEHACACAWDRAIRDMPARRRQIYLLRTDCTMTAPAIAETVGVSLKTVEYDLARARKTIRAALGDLASL